MKLVKYRDAGMHTYTYFWISNDQRIVSGYFDTEQDANAWLEQQLKKWTQDEYDICGKVASGTTDEASQKESQEATDGTRSKS